MNARKTLLILGIIALVLLVSIVALAIFFHRQMEQEKNAAKTERARQARWQKPEATKESPSVEPEKEEPKLDGEENEATN